MNKKQLNYPPIPDTLIEKLSQDFPDKLPREELTPFKQGVLVGQQIIIDKLRFEAEEQNGS